MTALIVLSIPFILGFFMVLGMAALFLCGEK